MTFATGSAANRAAVLIFSAILMAGCGQQNKQQNRHQNNAQATQEQTAGGGAGGHQRLRAVCADDIQKYCANADKKRRCLRDNIDKLSDTCKAALAQRHGRKARDNGATDD